MDMKYLLLSVLSICFLAACQKPETGHPPLDGKALAERFIKPAGDQGVAGIVFNKEGDAIAITADGKIVEPCRLPSMDEKSNKTTSESQVAVPLAECHGTTDTSIYSISQVSAVRHKGSNCITFAMVADGVVTARTVCW
jgi:fructose-1,6-bisphosphatase/inositol monophosphatase family enzyme